jgi:hypothetical protein
VKKSGTDRPSKNYELALKEESNSKEDFTNVMFQSAVNRYERMKYE